MFKKLLKYDFLAVWRVWWIIAASMLVLSVIGGFFLRLEVTFLMTPGLEIFGVFGIFLLSMGSFLAFGSVAGIQILVYSRYYKSLFTDEGYLTFTLPVSRKTILLSKTVNAMLWNLLHVAFLFLCACIIDLISSVGMETAAMDEGIVRPLGMWLTTIWAECGAWTILYAVAILLLVVGGLAVMVNVIHFCITVGSIVAKKAKLLAGVGVYYLVNLIMTLIIQVFGGFFATTVMMGIDEMMVNASISMHRLTTFLLLMIAAMIVGIVAVVMYGITLGKLERKLNLA